MEVAIYARVSTTGKGQDTENQLIILRQYCIKMGYTVYGEYIDHESGGSATRPQFLKMYAAASKRKFDMVLFWSLDRLTREGVRKTIYYLQQLEDNHVLYKSYTEQFIDSSGVFRDVVVSLLAVMAQQEKIRCSDRVKAGLSRSRANGRIGGRPKLTSELTEQISELNSLGWSMRKIGEKLKISHRTVGNYLKN